MGSLSKIGRIFYGVVIAGMGFLTIYYKAFPYMFFPSQNLLAPGFAVLTYISGTLLILAGACIVFDKKTRLVSLLLGCALLVIICFFFIPYEFMDNPDYTHLREWENAEKELALAGGAFAIAGCISGKNEYPLTRFWSRLIAFGAILYSIPIISFGILHFQFAKGVSTMIPSWVPDPLFWTYLAGAALLGSGIAMILKFRTGLIAALLGIMIFIWFIILHIPRVLASSSVDIGDEMASAFLALAYSGIAFVISGSAKKISSHK